MLAAVSLQTWINSQSEAKRRMRWGSNPVSPYIAQSINTICQLSWPYPSSPSVTLVIHSDVFILADKPGSNICFSTLRQITWMSDWWIVSSELWRAGSPKPQCQLIIIIMNIKKQCVPKEGTMQRLLQYALTMKSQNTALLLSPHFFNLTTHDLILIKNYYVKQRFLGNIQLQVNTA